MVTFLSRPRDDDETAVMIRATRRGCRRATLTDRAACSIKKMRLAWLQGIALAGLSRAERAQFEALRQEARMQEASTEPLWGSAGVRLGWE